MLQQATPPVLDHAADAVVVARGMGAKTVLALKRQLEALHFRVIVAGSAEAAVAAACGRKVALLLAPAGEEGATLFWRLRRLLAEEERPRCLAIAEEEMADAATVLAMLMAGADDCLVWPFGARLLAQRLQQVLAAA